MDSPPFGRKFFELFLNTADEDLFHVYVFFTAYKAVQ